MNVWRNVLMLFNVSFTVNNTSASKELEILEFGTIGKNDNEDRLFVHRSLRASGIHSRFPSLPCPESLSTSLSPLASPIESAGRPLFVFLAQGRGEGAPLHNTIHAEGAQIERLERTGSSIFETTDKTDSSFISAHQGPRDIQKNRNIQSDTVVTVPMPNTDRQLLVDNSKIQL